MTKGWKIKKRIEDVPRYHRNATSRVAHWHSGGFHLLQIEPVESFRMITPETALST